MVCGDVTARGGSQEGVKVMRKLEAVILGVVGSLVLFFFAYVFLVFYALNTLEAKYTGLSGGMTVEETDRFMGSRFSAQTIEWDDIPEAWSVGTEMRQGGSVRDYQLHGLGGLNIIVLYDEDGHLYSSIPCYE